MQHRLCLVAVKCFPENTYFSEMLISGKGKCFHVFGCISKNFPENIFWCLEMKKENTNPEKIINDRDPRSRDRGRRRDLANARSRSSDWSSRDRLGLELGVRRRSSDWLELGVRRRSSDWLELGLLLSRARSLSLSLSLFPEILWSENEGRKSFPGQKWKYWSTGSHFPENIIFHDSQTRGFYGKWFLETVFT